jgi:hypothetical protein
MCVPEIFVPQATLETAELVESKAAFQSPDQSQVAALLSATRNVEMETRACLAIAPNNFSLTPGGNAAASGSGRSTSAVRLVR